MRSQQGNPDQARAGGNSSPENQSRRRDSVNVKHALRHLSLECFDATDTNQTSPIRFVTTRPTQAPGLLALNLKQLPYVD
jgi:hypothetical protein